MENAGPVSFIFSTSLLKSISQTAPGHNKERQDNYNFSNHNVFHIDAMTATTAHPMPE